MPPFRVSMEVQNTKVKLEFARIKGRSRSLTPVFRAISEDFQRIMIKQFDTEGDYLSGGWAGLSESRLDQKAAQGLDDQILVAFGDLRNSLTGGSNSFREVGHASMVMGSTDPTAGMHQYGTSKMPARPLFEMTKTISHRWTGAFANYLVNGRISLVRFR